ncbi:MAG TPA: type II toxin-antitoxin system VapC family toxin [Armatimonadota bacterium]|jgi:predicted nucleic acid-binding protein
MSTITPFSCVIDANILLKAVSVEDYAVEILDFLQAITPGIELHAPVLARLECANALRTRVMRFKYPVEQAREDLRELMRLDVTYYPLDPLITTAFEIGCQYGVSAYDGVYVALAESLQLPLLTADHPAVNNLRSGPYQIITPQQLFGTPK